MLNLLLQIVLSSTKQSSKSNGVTKLRSNGDCLCWEHPQRVNVMLDPKYTNEYSNKSGKLRAQHRQRWQQQTKANRAEGGDGGKQKAMAIFNNTT